MNLFDGISPINGKKTKFALREQFCLLNNNQFEMISHAAIENRITETAKTIVYLFSPDIDLLQHLQQQLENYDKYQKAKFLLRQFISSFRQHQFFDQIFKTSKEIQQLQFQVKKLNFSASQLAKQKTEKDQQIAKFKNIIIQLSKAYDEAKMYYTDEILELKYKISELTISLNREQKRKSQKMLSPKKNQQTPKKIKQNDIYTDKSIYKRFSVLNHQENTNTSQNINNPQKQKNKNNDIYSVQEQGKDAKIKKLQQIITKSDVQYQSLKRSSEREAHLMSEKISKLEAQLKSMSIKLKQKNKIINELLDSVERKY